MPRRRRGLPPNTKLRAARERLLSPSGSGRPMSTQELAEAVNAWLWDTYRQQENLTYRDVAALERGEVRWPGERRRKAFRAVTGASSDTELGFYINRGRVASRVATGAGQQSVEASPTPGWGSCHEERTDCHVLDGYEGPAWTSDFRGAPGAAVTLWDEKSTANVEQAADLDTAGEVAFRWLVAPRDRWDHTGNGACRVGMSDVARVRAVRATLKSIDNTHGGGAALPMAAAYLRDDVRPLTLGRFDERTGRALLGATAELELDLGWMAYDQAYHPLSTQHMIQALRLSHAAADRLFGGRVLAALSHQALHVGRIPLAIDLARAARTGTEQVATPRAGAMFAAMEAMAHAAGNNAERAIAALGVAERAMEKADASDDDPDWLDFDEGGLWGHAARVFRYLDRGPECERYANLAITMCRDDHGRTRAQRQAILAAGHLQRGECEQAAATAAQVVTAAWGLTSRHVDQEIAVLARQLRRIDSRCPACVDFLNEAEDYLNARAPE